MKNFIFWDYNYDDIPSVDIRTEDKVICRFFLDAGESPKHKVKLAEDIIEKYNNHQITFQDVCNISPKGLIEPHIVSSYINSYFLSFIKGATLIGFLPALSKSKMAMTYYSVSSDHPDLKQVSPVWLVEGVPGDINTYFLGDDERFFYTWVKQKGVYVNVPVDNLEKQKYILERPVLIYFMGCDDGSTGLRFKTKEDALEYLSNIFVYEEIYHHNCDLRYYN